MLYLLRIGGVWGEWCPAAQRRNLGIPLDIAVICFLLIVLPIGGIYVQSFSGGWQAFRESIAEPLAWHAVALTFRLALIATAINMIIGTMTAWVLHRYRFAGRAWLNSLVDLPFALPTAVGGLMILLLLGPGSLAGRAAEEAGWRLVLAEPAIVVSMVFVTFRSSSGRCSRCSKRRIVPRRKRPTRSARPGCGPSCTYCCRCFRASSAARCSPSPGRWPNSGRSCS